MIHLLVSASEADVLVHELRKSGDGLAAHFSQVLERNAKAERERPERVILQRLVDAVNALDDLERAYAYNEREKASDRARTQEVRELFNLVRVAETVLKGAAP